MIERQIERDVRARMETTELREITVQVDGQEVLIRALASAPVTQLQHDQLAFYAYTTECLTAFGSSQCPTNVRLELTESEPTHRYHDFDMIRREGTLTVSGECPTTQDKTEWLDQIRAAFGEDTLIVDSLRITGEQATPSWTTMASGSTRILSLLVTGTAGWNEGTLSIRGVHETDDNARLAKSEFNELTDETTAGSFDLTPMPDEDGCNSAFAEVLADNTIEFETARAVISAVAAGVLDRVATTALRCPMELQISGHTDNTGNPELNRDLSLRRAQAVVDALVSRGIESSRLQARGYGADKPRADNATEAGRTRNRRIEIQVSASEEKSP
ncbi:MAG: OmpA family protein [Myxococcota bacterium]